MVLYIDIEENTNLNIEEHLKSMHTLINIWKGRKLSLKGQITTLRTLILLQIQFLFSMILIPNIILKQLDQIFFENLWGDKSTKIKSNNSSYQKMRTHIDICVYDIHAAAKCNWIRCL